MLRIDPALDRMPPNLRHPRHNVAQLLARRNPQLSLYQVDARHHLGHAMLHLDARVHLDEINLAVLIHQELDRPRVPVANLLERLLDHLAQLLALLGRHL